MKINATVTKVEVITPSLAWLSTGQLEVSCGDQVRFRVDDNATMRKTYLVGREIDLAVTPRKS